GRTTGGRGPRYRGGGRCRTARSRSDPARDRRDPPGARRDGRGVCAEDRRQGTGQAEGDGDEGLGRRQEGGAARQGQGGVAGQRRDGRGRGFAEGTREPLAAGGGWRVRVRLPGRQIHQALGEGGEMATQTRDRAERTSDGRAPEKPSRLGARSWFGVLWRTFTEF